MGFTFAAKGHPEVLYKGLIHKKRIPENGNSCTARVVGAHWPACVVVLWPPAVSGARRSGHPSSLDLPRLPRTEPTMMGVAEHEMSCGEFRVWCHEAREDVRTAAAAA